MNFIDAAGLLADSAILPLRDVKALEAKQHVRNVIFAYDALAPDWNSAPKFANHYAIDADGTAAWYRTEPYLSTVVGEETFWQATGSGNYQLARENIRLAPGIDWRECKWSRPQKVNQ